MSDSIFSFSKPLWDGTSAHKCYICYSTFVKGFNRPSRDYRCRVMESCASTLFSEIKGDEFDYNLIKCTDDFPFCNNCWESMENIHDLNHEKDNAENSIENIAKNLAAKVLYNRKYLKKNGVLSTAKTNPIFKPYGAQVKLEGFSVHQNIVCKLCHNTYKIGDSNHSLSLDISDKVAECCEKHLFPELIDEGFFEWNSIPFNNSVPFCGECSFDTKSIVELDEKLKNIETSVSTVVDTFTLNVLKRRRSYENVGQHGFRYRDDFGADICDAVSADCKQDLDDDCQIVYESITNVYPGNLVETILSQDSDVESMEQSYSESLSPSNTMEEFPEEEIRSVDSELTINQEYLYSQGNGLATTNFPIASNVTAQGSGSQSMIMKDEKLDVQGESQKFPVASTSLGIEGNKLKNKEMPVCVVKLSMQQSGMMFRCPTCKKIFIFRKSWEAHLKICPKSLNNSMNDGQGRGARLISKPLTRSKLKVTKSQLQHSEKFCLKGPVQYQCHYCDKRIPTKSGLNLHTRSHTKLDAHKCSQCTRSFGYAIQLKKHYRDDHFGYSTFVPNKPYKPKPKKIIISVGFQKNMKRRNFRCPFCPAPIFKRMELMDHVQSHYDIASGFRCEICKMVFAQKKSLKPHNKSFHKHLF